METQTYFPETIIQPKQCTACGKPVRGRTDKKFCDDYCRNNYNNRLKAESNNLVRNVNHALGKNRRILEEFFRKTEKNTKATTAELLHSGFQFRYFTHQLTNRRGMTFFFCYDYGYQRRDGDSYVIIKTKS